MWSRLPCCRLSATVVLADGSVVTAGDTEHADLPWALKGSGGNFGVVAALVIRLESLSDNFGGIVYYRMEDAPEVLRFYRQWTSELHNETTTVLRL